MITCSKVDADVAEVAYVRRHLQGAWSSTVVDGPRPPAIGRAWVARDAGRIVGALHVEKDEGRQKVEMHVDDVQAVGPLVRCLQPGGRYAFEVRDNARQALLEHVESPQPENSLDQPKSITLALAKENYLRAPGDEQVRRLGLADLELVTRFPAYREFGWGQAFYVHYLRQAAGDDQIRVFGLVRDGELATYCVCQFAVEDTWIVSVIATHPGHRRQGLARLTLSHACGELLGMGRRLVYNCWACNAASLRAAQSVGFRRQYRTYVYSGTVPLAGPPRPAGP